MPARRPARIFDWTAVTVVFALIGLYAVTWFVFRPRVTPVFWKGPHHTVFKRQASDGEKATPSLLFSALSNAAPADVIERRKMAAFDIITTTATSVGITAGHSPPCVCEPCPDRLPSFTDCIGNKSLEQLVTSPALGHQGRKVKAITCETDTSVGRVSCLKDDVTDEVYLPASFVTELFEVYGQIRTRKTEGKEEVKEEFYDFRYSQITLYPPQPVYHPGGVFLNFEHIHVEHRPKVVCVTAAEGVPLTNQWSPQGYYYAITVAQFGLSHHAKGLLDGNPNPLTLANAEMNFSTWKFNDQINGSAGGDGGVDGGGGSATNGVSIRPVELTVNGLNRRVLAFHSSASPTSPGPTLDVNSKNLSLACHLMFLDPGGITVKIKTKDGGMGYLHYINHEKSYIRVGGSSGGSSGGGGNGDGGGDNINIDNDYSDDDGDANYSNHVYYGMNVSGSEVGAKWRRLVRDVGVDWWKAKPSSSPVESLVSISLHGHGYLDNVTLATSAHVEHLIQAADWLVSNQDSRGGWPTAMAIQTGPISLQPGWYSAMGQGQAMSTLVRAYNITGDDVYLAAAVKATSLFMVPSLEGGVLARFLNHTDWYEEYPTTPGGTFVLNGFIFSLLGLYDVMKTAQGEGRAVAERLWTTGVTSLKSLLGMFDSGTGSFYDLRHVVHGEQPNRARWDYHAVHVALLQQMTLLDGSSPVFPQTVDRWLGYFHGRRSKHN